MPHPTIFTTNRSPRHQKRALDAAPPELSVTVLANPSFEELRPHLAQAEYLISERVGVIDEQTIQAAPNLKLILRLGSMTYDIDVETAKAAGIIVCTWPDSGAAAVSEHCVMQLLALSRRLLEVQAVAVEANPKWGASRPTNENTFSYNWSGRKQLKTLYGQTIGILGFGEIGSELARRLKGWGCRLLYSKRKRLPASVEAELGLTYADNEMLRAQSDLLMSLLPYTPETIKLIDAKWLADMKSGAMIASCGSGGTIDEQALADAIRSGHIDGAAMDSFSAEPLQADNPLVKLAREGANVLLTPHTAGSGYPRSEDYTNILRHLRGEPILNRVV
jgi:phosphoglycerate dehydrogenase-like enzyme